MIGYAKDAEARALMKYCKAFVFPSTYEGFGIPPMEALCMGARIILGDIPVLHEIYGESALYINCNDADVNLDELLDNSDAKKERNQQLRCLTHIHGRSQQQVWHSLWTGMRLVYRVIIKYEIRGRL